MINQITQIQMPDGESVALTDWSARPLYSTVDLLSGFTDEEIRAFSYTEGETVSGSSNNTANQREASLRDTNVDSPSEIDSTQEYLVYALSVELHQWTAAEGVLTVGNAGEPIPRAPNVSQLAARIILELEASDKAFPQAGLGWFPAGFGPSTGVTGQAAGAATYGNNGAPSLDAVDFLPIPVHLGGTEDYVVIFHNPPNGPDGGTTGAVNFLTDAGNDDADAVITARVYFRGLQKRATA